MLTFGQSVIISFEMAQCKSCCALGNFRKQYMLLSSWICVWALQSIFLWNNHDSIFFWKHYQEEDCEKAYFKMDNVLIDDRRIHVDFSQSVAKIRWKGKGRYTWDSL